MKFEVITAPSCSANSLNIYVYFKDNPSLEARKDFEELIYGWYSIGIHGGFGGFLHSMSEIDFDGQVAVFWLDMGNAKKLAIEVLLRALEGFVDLNRLQIEKVILGTITE